MEDVEGLKLSPRLDRTMPRILEADVRQICGRIGDRLEGLRGRTLLVAGGGGFLPSYFLDVAAYANDHVLDPPCLVISVDNFSTGLVDRLTHLQTRGDFRFLHHDLGKPLSLEEPVHCVIHGASIASPAIYRRYPLETIDVNVLGTRNLLELAREKKVESILYLSSSESYGDPTLDAIPTPETYRGNVSCTGPRACYDESKRLAETLCTVYHREFGVPVKIVRPFNVYGPRLRLDDGRVVPDFLKDALRGEPITLFSDGKASRSFCYVSDAVTAMLLLLFSDENGEAFNVGSDEEVTIEFLAREISVLSGGTRGVRYARSSDTHYLSDNPSRSCPDLTKVKRTIPWEPRVKLREGLRRTLQWYLEEQRA